MKISEVQDVLKELKDKQGDMDVLGISVNQTKITICFEDTSLNVICHKADYKNCDI